ncbi:MAG TPA: PfkB family carbohydrate kinase [Conexivisphaerales archaeon]|nr:PfkB family carbohydrate kinase [Conexivisphaerales archaeon]
MKALVAGHLVLDTISTEGYSSESMGGPPAYMGLLLRRLGFDVTLSTRIGYDFGDERLRQLQASGIRFLSPPLTESPTTRFEITFLWDRRVLRLLSRCDSIPPPRIGLPDYDVVLVNPVAGEIAVDSLPRYKAISKFTYLDPQGFLRSFDDGLTTLAERPELKGRLRGLDAIKVDTEEGMILTGRDDPREISFALAKLGVKECLVTVGGEGTYLREGTRLHFLKPPSSKPFDAVGTGDLLGAGYAAARTNRDPPGSLAFAVACASCRINRPALDKIPEAVEVEKLSADLRPRVETLEGLG